MRTEKLKFKTDLGGRVIDGLSITHQMSILRSRQLEKIFVSAVVVRQFDAGLYFGFQILHFICDKFIFILLFYFSANFIFHFIILFFIFNFKKFIY